MKPQLDMEKIASGLRAKRKGRIASSGGYFGAVQLRAEVQARFRMPAGGGRRTDPHWTHRRLIPLTPQTLEHLEALSARAREDEGIQVEPMQLAALLLEQTTERITANDHEPTKPRRRRERR